ncbi:PA14 domain-containing protein [Niveibacterium sp. 24ML]|uniref:TIM-barrel domain-containing protein n=1 Tax=Niveibacterium sp. 24ML TaxID=2985512 RepID=UPI00226E81E9|nr:TIM-barrel domain-containing protein [Niveibacterium sp. 24ML]MCX9155684.1 PA14 domain-containing protein [Niveibacterium sp. 24ML]
MIILSKRVRSAHLSAHAVTANIISVSITPDGHVLTDSLFVLPQAAALLAGAIDENAPLRLRWQDETLHFTGPDGTTWLTAGEHQCLPGDEALAVSQTFQADPAHALFGLGQYPGGAWDWRNREVLLAQSNQGIAVPFLVSTAGFGILWDSMALTRFKSADGKFSFASDCADGIRYYVVWGPDFDRIVAGFRQLTGAAPLFPRWAYGYWQSKERYVDRAELLATAQRFRDTGFPIDALIQDWKYWGDKPWSCMEWDDTVFPDPEGMIRALHAQHHLRLMTTLWPVVGEGCALFDELKAAGELFESPHWAKGHIYDAFNEQGRAIYWKHVKRGLIDKGVDALWMDGTEPEFVSTHDLMDGVKACYAQRDTALGSWRRVLNGYSLYTARGVYEGQRAMNSGKRVFTLSRSGFAGQQRYAAASWSGDIAATWKVLREQVAAGLNFAAAGMPYWTTDIGGFFTTGLGARFPDGNADPAYRELYVRWFQYGAFCPLFRSHGTNTAREPWHFGEPGSDTYEALLAAAQLRYRLLPYIYSIAWDITQNGGTLMRPLAMDFRADPATYGIADQFMFGPAIMVCPVLEPMFFEPRREAEVIPAEHLRAPDGAPGLAWRGFTGCDFDTPVFDKRMDELSGNWAGGPPPGLPFADYSLRWEAELTVPESGDYEFLLAGNDGRRLWLGDELLIDGWHKQGFATWTVRRTLLAGTALPLRVDYFHHQGAAQISLSWRRPGHAPKSELVPPRRQVYLPAGCNWVDFHSGEHHTGGQTLTVPTPISQIPLFVRAGSILPLGDAVTRSEEQIGRALELRVYPGADASFTLYEDAGDGYHYEHGEYATTELKWDEAKGELMIGLRTGSYPDAPEAPRFEVRLAGSSNAVTLSARAADAWVTNLGRIAG